MIIDYYVTLFVTLPLLILNIVMALDYIDFSKYYYLKLLVLLLSILMILYILLFSWWRFEHTGGLFSTYYPIWRENKGLSSYYL